MQRRIGSFVAGVTDVPSDEAHAADRPRASATSSGVDIKRARSTFALIAVHVADLDAAPTDAFDAYLRLHLLSPGWSNPARSTSTASSAS